MLHLDGSVHEWFTGHAGRPCLIAVSDDATKRVLHAALYPSESTWAVMTSLGTVLRAEGLPIALYTDRAHWAFHTPKAKGPVDKARLKAAAVSSSGPCYGDRGVMSTSATIVTPGAESLQIVTSWCSV